MHETERSWRRHSRQGNQQEQSQACRTAQASGAGGGGTCQAVEGGLHGPGKSTTGQGGQGLFLGDFECRSKWFSLSLRLSEMALTRLEVSDFRGILVGTLREWVKERNAGTQLARQAWTISAGLLSE